MCGLFYLVVNPFSDIKQDFQIWNCRIKSFFSCIKYKNKNSHSSTSLDMIVFAFLMCDFRHIFLKKLLLLPLKNVVELSDLNVCILKTLHCSSFSYYDSLYFVWKHWVRQLRYFINLFKMSNKFKLFWFFYTWIFDHIFRLNFSFTVRSPNGNSEVKNKV